MTKMFISRWIFMVCFVLSVSTRPLAAQGIGSRTSFVYHVYVDPIYGDDTQAGTTGINPVGGTATGLTNNALSLHPTTPAPAINGRIHHAPYSFRTVTAALGYINTQFVPGSFPWSNPNNPSYQIEHIVIHCLPGLYGPGTDIDTRSGLRYNGETFPLQIPVHVAIQGASALDTIFDGRGRDGYFNHIFEFKVTYTPPSHEDSFIDAVTIRSARGSEFVVNPPQGAGIALVHGVTGGVSGAGQIRCTISNCIITDCDVGIAIDSFVSNPNIFAHSPIIVNCTIAWNRIGIYSGILLPATPGVGFTKAGYGRPRIYNTIFDSGDPDNQFASTGTSCFEGLDPTDLTVQSIGTTTVNIDFNAYEQGRYNFGIIPPAWNALVYQTQPRSSSPVYSPRVDILPYTNTGTATPRKALYVNETFKAMLGATSIQGSLSPHDFRLTIHPRATINDPLVLNPLVNKGVDTSAGSLTFQNQIFTGTLSPTITSEPGLLGPGSQTSGASADYATLHSGDWDLEGYGNLRTELRGDFPSPPTYSTYRDIGADELANGLIMAGYINDTRIFSSNVPGTSGGANPPNNLSVYFIHRYYQGNVYPRPQTSIWIGQIDSQFTGTIHWWEYVQQVPGSGTNPVTPNPLSTSSYYTLGDTGTLRYGINTSASPYEPIMRNLECDFSPTLIADLHPTWAVAFTDIFAANPWWGHQGTPAHTVDNRYLYYAPLSGYATLEGTINPSGTYLWQPTTGYVAGTRYQFGPYGYTGSSTYTVNTWGVGDVAGPDIMPTTTTGQGVRFNCQVFVWDPNSQQYLAQDNLQTFLGVNFQPSPTSPSGNGPALGEVGRWTKSQVSSLEESMQGWLIKKSTEANK